MSDFELYEGAEYYFDLARDEIGKNNYDKSSKYIAKGYKHISSTDLDDDCELRARVESTVNALKEKRDDESLEHISDILSQIQSSQREDLLDYPT